jgi:hypothetical protein
MYVAPDALIPAYHFLALNPFERISIVFVVHCAFSVVKSALTLYELTLNGLLASISHDQDEYD